MATNVTLAAKTRLGKVNKCVIAFVSLEFTGITSQRFVCLHSNGLLVKIYNVRAETG